MTPPVDPAQFAALVRDTSDEDLERGVAVNGGVLLPEIFAAMPALLDPEAVEGISAVAEWRIACPPDGAVSRWQVTIASGTCTVSDEPDGTPDVVFHIGAVDFLRLITGGVEGPQLYVFGSLRIEGDLLTAACYTSFFRLP